jgi:hypothetical protein
MPRAYAYYETKPILVTDADRQAHSRPHYTVKELGNRSRAALAHEQSPGLRSGAGQKLIDYWLVFRLERIDKRDVLQRESILKIFGQDMPDAGTLCRGP